MLCLIFTSLLLYAKLLQLIANARKIFSFNKHIINKDARIQMHHYKHLMII